MSRNRASFLSVARRAPGAVPLLLELRRTLRGCQTVLDLGCGNLSPLTTLPDQQLTGFEGFAPSLAEARARQTHDELVLGDVRAAAQVLAGRRFDACVALDLIEHLPKEDGWKLLDAMESLATRRVVVFTPNGFLPQRGHGDLQEHLSGWTVADMQSRGYRVIGLYGLKSLRGEYHRICRRPKVFWVVVSVLSQILLTRWHPQHAAAIYCVKHLGGSTADRG